MRRNSSILICLLGLLVSSCASNGGLAGKDKPLDKEATRLAICEGAHKIDLAFWIIAGASPGLIPGQAMDVEGALIATVGFKAGSPDVASQNTVCTKTYTGDVDVAINTAIIATANISRIIQAWNK